MSELFDEIFAVVQNRGGWGVEERLINEFWLILLAGSIHRLARVLSRSSTYRDVDKCGDTYQNGFGEHHDG